MRFAFAIAVSAVMHVPLIAAGEEPETALVGSDGVIACGPWVSPDEIERVDDVIELPPPASMRLDEPRQAAVDPALDRQMAIEAARVGSLVGYRPRPWLYDEPPMKPAPRREVEVVRPTVAGDLEHRVVRRFVQFHAHEFARCNHAQLDEVRLRIELLIAADGTVFQSKVHGDEPAIAACVDRTLRAIEFPRTGGPTQAAVRMTLRPRVERSLYGTISNEPDGFVR